MAESTLARYDRLNRRSRQLDAAAATVPAALAGPPVTAVHQAAAEVFGELIRFGSGAAAGGTAPLALRALMRTVEKSEPMLVDGLAKMPPDQIVTFMAELIAKLQRIVDASADGSP